MLYLYDTTDNAGRVNEQVSILGMLLVILAGVAENAAVLSFSPDTLITTTGIASAITSSYSLIVILFGIIVYSERLTRNQVVGISVFMAGLGLLALIK